MSSPSALAFPQFTTEQCSEFQRRGLVHIKNVFTQDEVAVWQEECQRLLAIPGLIDESNLRTRFRELSTGGKGLGRMDPVCDISPVFAALAQDERVVHIASTLLGEPARMFKNKLLIKMPNMVGYRLHQDYTYWQMEIPADHLLTLQIPIDPMAGLGSPLEIFPGTHHQLLQPPGVIVDPTEDQVSLEDAELLESYPGDVVAFHSLLVHRSRNNQVSHPLFVLYFSYCAGRYGDCSEAYYELSRRFVRTTLPPELREQAYFR